MQVTHAADHVTHAMIGGKKTIEFGISNSAAFFQILSSTLYSNQPLAVAREVLCNAWDAHIRAGATHLPVRVTIDDTKIVVEDSGEGIADDMMGPLYGTYGGTDKTNNGTETGGFGLGCKAPFAYTDHFEVTSCHQGVKTIYNLSKSSADKLGKPGITTIVAFPTTETGLKVVIPLLRRLDRPNFEALFNRIARNGEMNVQINGTTCGTVPLSSAESNWLFTTEDPLGDPNSRFGVFVRYGNVIYPVERHVAYANFYDKIEGFTHKLSTRSNIGYKLIFQAPPNTIAVTPSRETLSMQEHTIETLKNLLEGFLAEDLGAKIGEQAIPLMEAQIQKAKIEGNIGALFTDALTIPGMNVNPYDYSRTFKQIPVISTIEALTEQYVSYHYPSNKEFHRQDMKQRIKAAVELKRGDRGHLELVGRVITTPGYKLPKKLRFKRMNQSYVWFKKAVLRPLYRDIAADPVLELKRLHILMGSGNYAKPRLLSPIERVGADMGDYLPILRKVIVLAYSQHDLWSRVQREMKENLKHLGSAEETWFYHAPVAKTKIQKIRDFFTQRGFLLVDFTEEITWAKFKIKNPTIASRVVKETKPKLLGYPALKGVNRVNGGYDLENCFKDDSPRILNPKFYLRVSYSRPKYSLVALGIFDEKASKLVVRLFGDDCAIVRTDTHEKKLKEAGLMDLDSYIIDHVIKEVTTSPTLLAYWPECIVRGLKMSRKIVPDTTQAQLLDTLFEVDEVRAIMGLTAPLSSNDRIMIRLWRYIQTRYIRDTDTVAINNAAGLIKALPVSPIISKIAGKAADDRFSDLFDLSKLRKMIRDPSSKTDGHLDRLANLVKYALAG